MARIRTIKPEFWEDERLGRLSLLARFTFAGLISLADDEGRGRGSAQYLRSRLHAYAADVSLGQMEAALQELQKAERVVFYEAGGDSFYWIPRFRDHQRIDKWTASKLPAPPMSALAEFSRTAPGVLPESSPPEGNGWEGKGTERSGREVERSGVDHQGRAGSPCATAPGDQPKKRLSPEALEVRRAALRAQAGQVAEVDAASTAGGEPHA